MLSQFGAAQVSVLLSTRGNSRQRSEGASELLSLGTGFLPATILGTACEYKGKHTLCNLQFDLLD